MNVSKILSQQEENSTEEEPYEPDFSLQNTYHADKTGVRKMLKRRNKLTIKLVKLETKIAQLEARKTDFQLELAVINQFLEEENE